MAIADYTEDLFDENQFKLSYEMIRASLLEGKNVNKEKNTIILGGQPGAGKSRFYSMNDKLNDYIAINGDEYRRFHPNYVNIIENDPAHYAERTQKFSNRVVETLISDLSDRGYNLIIEGTLRNPEVPLRTCEYLKGKGYKSELVVVSCDAEKAWQSTISRASLLKEKGLAPRVVPIDIYNNTVNGLPYSLDRVENENCFDSITIINREGEILYEMGQGEKAMDVMKNELNLDNWNQKFPEYVNEFETVKNEIFEKSIDKDFEVDVDER